MARVKHTATRRGRTQSARTPPEGSSPATSPATSRGPGRPRKNPISPGSRTPRTPRSNAATGPPTQTQRKKRRNRPGTAALREIRFFQKSVKLVIPSAPFIRCVREISSTLSNDVTRWTAEALQCIHEVNNYFSSRQQRIIWFICLKIQCSVQFMQSV
uniref:histone H3-4 isoform X2 n=1 Tax=Fragaria vesca subsp. vesca TaxID=101020 RepID=UPI0005CA7EA5|nr:PREDICTED: histone H3-4 isoform X2 [Fragaria vesca subsp. vesca]